jgi:hypothetical protein
VKALATRLRELEEETAAAGAAAAAGDLARCQEALTRRAAIVAELSAAAGESPEDRAAIHRAASRALASDAALVEALGADREAARNALDEVRHARRAASRASAPAEGGRFVCERV